MITRDLRERGNKNKFLTGLGLVHIMKNSDLRLANAAMLWAALPRGSPILLLKTPSHKSNWPFHASQKI